MNINVYAFLYACVSMTKQEEEIKCVAFCKFKVW